MNKKAAGVITIYDGGSVEAASICSLLGGSGVDAVMQPTFNYARCAGGRVLVPAAQGERAREVLKAYGVASEDEVLPQEPADFGRNVFILSAIIFAAFAIILIVLAIHRLFL